MSNPRFSPNMSDYKRIGNIEVGRNEKGGHAGLYQEKEGLERKVFFKQDPDCAKVMAEIIAGQGIAKVMGDKKDTAAHVFYATSPDGDIYVGSQDVDARPLYKVAYKAAGLPEPAARPKFAGSNPDVKRVFDGLVTRNEDGGYESKYPGFSEAWVASVLWSDFDLHSDNLMVQIEKQIIKRIDFGAAMENLEPKIHPHSRSRHLRIGKPTNHAAEWNKDLRVNKLNAEEACKQSQVDLTKFIDRIIHETYSSFHPEKQKKFKNWIGSGNKNLKQFLLDIMKARQNDLAIFSKESKVSLCFKQVGKGKFVFDDRDYNIVELIKQYPDYFKAGDFHFRGRGQKKHKKMLHRMLTEKVRQVLPKNRLEQNQVKGIVQIRAAAFDGQLHKGKRHDFGHIDVFSWTNRKIANQSVFDLTVEDSNTHTELERIASVVELYRCNGNAFPYIISYAENKEYVEEFMQYCAAMGYPAENHTEHLVQVDENEVSELRDAISNPDFLVRICGLEQANKIVDAQKHYFDASIKQLADTLSNTLVSSYESSLSAGDIETLNNRIDVINSEIKSYFPSSFLDQNKIDHQVDDDSQDNSPLDLYSSDDEGSRFSISRELVSDFIRKAVNEFVNQKLSIKDAHLLANGKYLETLENPLAGRPEIAKALFMLNIIPEKNADNDLVKKYFVSTQINRLRKAFADNPILSNQFDSRLEAVKKSLLDKKLDGASVSRMISMLTDHFPLSRNSVAYALYHLGMSDKNNPKEAVVVKLCGTFFQRDDAGNKMIKSAPFLAGEKFMVSPKRLQQEYNEVRGRSAHSSVGVGLIKSTILFIIAESLSNISSLFGKPFDFIIDPVTYKTKISKKRTLFFSYATQYPLQALAQIFPSVRSNIDIISLPNYMAIYLLTGAEALLRIIGTSMATPLEIARDDKKPFVARLFCGLLGFAGTLLGQPFILAGKALGYVRNIVDNVYNLVIVKPAAFIFRDKTVYRSTKKILEELGENILKLIPLGIVAAAIYFAPPLLPFFIKASPIVSAAIATGASFAVQYLTGKFKELVGYCRTPKGYVPVVESDHDEEETVSPKAAGVIASDKIICDGLGINPASPRTFGGEQPAIPSSVPLPAPVSDDPGRSERLDASPPSP